MTESNQVDPTNDASSDSTRPPVIPKKIRLYKNASAWKNSTISGFVIAFALAGGTLLYSSFAATPAQVKTGVPSNYQLVWSDEFNSTATDGTQLDNTKWNVKTDQGATPDVQYSTDALSEANGALKVSTYTQNPNTASAKHVSGWITSENKYQPKYGYIQARIRYAPTTNNVLMGFWLFNGSVNNYGDPWNHGTEMDITEHVKSNDLTTDISGQATSSLHWGQYGADWDNHPIVTSGLRGAGLASGYHIYAMQWTPTTETYFIDGKYAWQVNNSSVTPVSQRDEFLVFSQHPPGGNFNYGTKSASTDMYIDYVRVYQQNPAPPAPPTNLTTVGGSGNTQIKWDIAANATSYKVKRTPAGQVNFTALGTTTQLSFTDTTASAAQSYSYVVTAVNASGESADSGWVTVTPNLALGKTIVASSARQPAANAIDNNAATMWESDWNIDPQWLRVDLGASTTINSVVLNWTESYATSYVIQTSNDASSWQTVYSTDGGSGGLVQASFPTVSARYVQMYGTSRGNRWVNPSTFGYALYEFEVYNTSVPPKPTNLNGYTADTKVMLNWNPSIGASGYTIKRATTPGGPYTVAATGVKGTSYTDTGLTNGTTYYHVIAADNGPVEGPYSNETRTTPHTDLALWQQTYASSKENADTRPYKIVDGEYATYNNITSTWASIFNSDPQWVCVDLQTTYPINRIVLTWDYMYATSYDVQVSNDTSCNTTNWQSVYSTSSATGGTNSINLKPVNSRLVRVYGKQRATNYGYSLKEVEVYGQ